MKAIVVLIVAVMIVAVFPARAQDCAPHSPTPDLLVLLDQYSQRTGVKFVVDPRVRAAVNLVGIDEANIDYSTLIGILYVHGFTALESQGVIYVVPEAAAANMQEKLESAAG